MSYYSAHFEVPYKIFDGVRIDHQFSAGSYENEQGLRIFVRPCEYCDSYRIQIIHPTSYYLVNAYFELLQQNPLYFISNPNFP